MWKTVNLGEACLVRRGTTITKEHAVEGDVPVIGGGTKPTYFHNEPNRAASCITVSGSGASAGFVNRWNMPIFASDCSTVEPKDETQLPQFVYYYLLSQQQFIYDNFRSGAAQPHVYAKDIETLDFPVLPLAEQERIVAKLDAAFAEIDRAVNATAASIEQAKIGLSNLIDDKTSNRSDWRQFKISDIGKVQTGTTPKTSEKDNYGSDIPFVKPPHFRTDGTIEIVGDGLSVSGAKASRTAAANSVMMVCIGATIGKVAVCHKDVCFNQQINSLSPAKEYDAELIYWQMRGNRFQREVRERAGQATLPIISKAKWASLSIYLPNSTEAQVQIRNQLRGLSDKTDEYCSLKAVKINELQLLKSAILSQELQPPQSEAA